MDWLKERLGENSTWLALGLLVFVFSRVTGTETGDIVEYIKAAVTDIGVIAASLAAAFAAFRSDKK